MSRNAIVGVLFIFGLALAITAAVMWHYEPKVGNVATCNYNPRDDGDQFAAVCAGTRAPYQAVAMLSFGLAGACGVGGIVVAASQLPIVRTSPLPLPRNAPRPGATFPPGPNPPFPNAPQGPAANPAGFDPSNTNPPAVDPSAQTQHHPNQPGQPHNPNQSGGYGT